MPRFYFHVHVPGNDALDDEGQLLPNLQAARACAAEAGCAMMAEQVRTGALDLRGYIEIAPEGRGVVETVHFQEMLTICGGEAN